jgi:osmotically-inducible protein OsmY
VRLAGIVGTRKEKRTARSIAQSAPGVQSVRADDVEVCEWLHSDIDAWYLTRTDREAEALIRSAIESQPKARVRNLVVDADGDVAILSGTVRALSEKRLVGREAQSESAIREV